MMAAVRGKGNRTTELAVRMMLVRAGLAGWTSHLSGLPGRPDFAFKKKRAAIFVHGCFWHQHGRCHARRVPNSNRAYWSLKLSRNVERDTKNKRKLRRLDWRVLTVWECEIGRASLEGRIKRFVSKA